MIKKIITGGQTGADQAGLDVAIKHGIPHGGWIPKGRLTEDGPLGEEYKLQEMETDSFPKRTEQNVLEADGTLVVTNGRLAGGSALTVRMAVKHNKPWLHVEIRKMSMIYAVRLVQAWLIDNGVSVLNIAGPRASHDPEIYAVVKSLMERLLGRSVKS